MKISDLIDLIRFLCKNNINPSAMNSLILLSNHLNNKKIDLEFISAYFDIPEDLIEEIMKRYVALKILNPMQKTSNNIYLIRQERLLEIYSLMKWLEEKQNLTEINKILLPDIAQVKFLYTIPRPTEEIHSNLIGELIDFIANSHKEILIISPFLDDVGINLILDSILSATKRGTYVKIVTRDILQGNNKNRDLIKIIIDLIEKNGDVNKLFIYEFNKLEFSGHTLHSKAMISDHKKVYIGSTNITEHSLRTSFEIGVLIEGKIVKDFENMIKKFLNSKLILQVSLSEI